MDGRVIDFLDPNQISNDLVFTALKTYPKAIFKINGMKEKAVILEASQYNGMILEHLISNFNDDFDVVLSCVQQNGSCYKHASWKLQNKDEIIHTALKNASNFDEIFPYVPTKHHSFYFFYPIISGIVKYFPESKNKLKILNNIYFMFSNFSE
jgi:sRNA-binding regulator protein Hfq